MVAVQYVVRCPMVLCVADASEVLNKWSRRVTDPGSCVHVLMSVYGRTIESNALCDVRVLCALLAVTPLCARVRSSSTAMVSVGSTPWPRRRRLSAQRRTNRCVSAAAR